MFASVYLPTEQNCTFCAASSSLSLACSCCIRLSSSCCPWKRMSKALLPLGSTGELSGLRSFQEPIMSRTRGLLGRAWLRTKSKVKADPKESGRKPRDLPNFGAILLLGVAIQDTQSSTMSSREGTYACVCQQASAQGSLWVEHPPAPTPLRCCCRCKTHSACSHLLSPLADKTSSS